MPPGPAACPREFSGTLPVNPQACPPTHPKLTVASRTPLGRRGVKVAQSRKRVNM